MLLLVLAITGFSIIGLWGFSASFLSRSKAAALAEHRLMLENFAAIVAEQSESIFAGSITFLKVVEAWIQSNPDKDPRTDPDFKKIVDIFRAENGEYIYIRFVSTDGKLYYIGGGPSSPRADVSDRDYYLAQKSPLTRGLYFAQAVKSRVTKVWGLPLSYPLPPNRFELELVFAAIELPLIVKSWENALPSSSSSINLIRSDGSILATSPFMEAFQGVSVAAGELWKNLPGKARGSIVIKKPLLSRSDILIAWKSLTKYPASATVSMPLSEVYEEWEEQLGRSLVTLTAVSLILIAMALLIARLLAKQRENEQRLEVLATRDALTGLYNRRYTIARLADEIERTKRHKRPLSCLMMDLDHFKACNDTFGHLFGDEILKAFAAVLTANTRRQDVAGRLGGEEFLLVLAETDKAEAFIVAEKLRAKTTEISLKDGKSLTVSIGVAGMNDGHATVEALLHAADQAMYRAKAAGRNRTM